jgi:polysaccharide biosynthesis protein PslJ
MTPPSRATARDGSAKELPLWPLWLLFGGFPLLWVLGLGGFATQIAAVPMAAFLCTTGRLRSPRVLWIWVLFLLWMCVAVVELSGGARVLGFMYRASLFLSATVVFLYIYNTSPRRLPLTRLCAMVTTFLAVVVAGGYLGIVAPHGSLTTPFQHLLPGSILSNDLVNKLVHPPFAQVSNSTYFHLAPRPAAPFPYTNDWGVNFALMVPFVAAWLAATRSRRVRIGLIALLAVALIPALLTLNRGMILGLSVGLVYAAIRFAIRGHGRALVLAVVILGLGAVVASALHFGSRLNDRLDQSQTNGSRLSVYSATYEQALQSPILGYGAPSASTVNVNGPQLGTQGELWLVLYSTGFPGALFFAFGLAAFAWRTRHPPNAPMMWLHVVPVIALVMLPVYRMEDTELALVMAATALSLRDVGASVRSRLPARRPAPRLLLDAPA